MKIDCEKFRVHGGEPLDLAAWPTRVPKLYKSKAHYQKLLAAEREQLAAHQELLYADHRYALLMILQAMDAGGKDSAIKHVMSGVNPQGCQVHSFKHPGPAELEHDFLWGPSRFLPARGHIGIFNRSYYEDVLIVRVHPQLLRAQRLPPEAMDGKTVWRQRFDSIGALEQHLHRNGTRVVKFFLHLSKDEQRRRLLQRVEDPTKNWKFDAADIDQREHWDEYMKAYQDCLSATSTAEAPWYAVPADDKKNARLIISRVIVEALKALELRYPKATPEMKRQLREAPRRLRR